MIPISFKNVVHQKFPFLLPVLLFVDTYSKQIALVLITIIFLLTYFESLRWPFPGLKATHGIAKGLSLILTGMLVLVWRRGKVRLKTARNFLIFVFFVSYLVSAVFSLDLATSLL